MNNKIMTKYLTILSVMFIIIIASTYSVAADINPGMITGKPNNDPEMTNTIVTEIQDSFMGQTTDIISKAGTYIAVGALMIIGIKYMMGSVEEKATYKKSMIPYFIGCFILFGASNLIPHFKDMFIDLETDTENFGNAILGLIQVVGTIISVGIIMVIGIKYMVGSVEQRASYKKSMIPFAVGAVLLFGAVNITTAIYNATPRDISVSESRKNAGTAARNYVNGIAGTLFEMIDNRSNYTESQIRIEYNNVKNQINAERASAHNKAQIAKEEQGEESADYIYWTEYASRLNSELNDLRIQAGL